MTVTSKGVPIVTSRQFTVALVPNAAQTGWNLVVGTLATGSPPMEWVVMQNFTTSPVQVTYNTPTHHYPNTNFTYQNGNQIRTQNRKVYFPSLDLYWSVYDETTESVYQLGPVVETPPELSTTAQQFYSVTQDVNGIIWSSTQESAHRPSLLISLDPATDTITSVAYYGSNSNAYSTYGYYTAPDTGGATKFVYGAYGEDPWQLWAINVTPGPNYGVTSKLIEVTSVGHISFQNIAGQGWAATVHTALGQAGDVVTQYWLNDGALVTKTNNINPSPRNTTPYSNPLVSPPQVDVSAGAGSFRWRPNGSSGSYTTITYDLVYANPVPIESLVRSNDGVAGNAQTYLGLFLDHVPTDTKEAFGAWPSGLSEGPRIYVENTIYLTGYPNSVLYSYDPTRPWDLGNNPPATAINPKNIGNYSPAGTQITGTKYSRHVAWSYNHRRLYMAGDRDRNGTGMGIGYWDKPKYEANQSAGQFVGVYATSQGSAGPDSMASVQPSGMVYDDTLDLLIVATRIVNNNPGTAYFMIFNPDLTLHAQFQPVPNLNNFGPIFPTSTPGIVMGMYQVGSNVILYQFDVLSGIILQSVTLSQTGALTPFDGYRWFPALHPNGSVWANIANTLVKIDPNGLSAASQLDTSLAAPVAAMAVAADGVTMFFGGGSPNGVNGAELFSTPININGADMSTDVPRSNLTTTQLMELGHFGRPLADALDSALGDISFLDDKNLTNGQGSTINACQPVYVSSSGVVSLAKADASSTSTVIGLVSQDTIAAGVVGRIRTTDFLEMTTAQWDAVCGTTGGLVPETTYYLSDTVAGTLTPMPPSAQGHSLVPVIYAVTSMAARLILARPILL